MSTGKLCIQEQLVVRVEDGKGKMKLCLLNEDLSVGRVAEGMETWGFESLAYGSVDLKKEM